MNSGACSASSVNAVNVEPVGFQRSLSLGIASDSSDDQEEIKKPKQSKPTVKVAVNSASQPLVGIKQPSQAAEIAPEATALKRVASMKRRPSLFEDEDDDVKFDNIE